MVRLADLACSGPSGAQGRLARRKRAVAQPVRVAVLARVAQIAADMFGYELGKMEETVN